MWIEYLQMDGVQVSRRSALLFSPILTRFLEPSPSIGPRKADVTPILVLITINTD
jgi:hypothetical protein